MDYIDYVLDQYYDEIELADEMEKQGFDNYDKYLEYLEDQKEEAQILLYESLQGK